MLPSSNLRPIAVPDLPALPLGASVGVHDARRRRWRNSLLHRFRALIAIAVTYSPPGNQIPKYR